MKPSPKLMSTIGDEMISGFKGGPSINLSSFRIGPTGGLYYSKAGRYPYGIYQQRSPDGTPYKELSKVTVRVKSKLQEPTSPTPNMALLNLHKMVHGLDKSINISGNGVHVHFSSSELGERSKRMETGGSFRIEFDSIYGPSSEAGFRGGIGGLKNVPARPHRGIQNAVAVKIKGILKAWLARYGSK